MGSDASLSHVGQILFEYVSELSRAELEVLYADAPSVRVIFREVLPPVAQQLLMRLLLGGARPFQESVLKRWCSTLSTFSHTVVLSVLQGLQILLPQKPLQKPGQPPPAQLFMLHKTFQSSLSAYLQGLQEPEAGEKGEGGPVPSGDVLLQHALASWESFLGELLDPDSKSPLADLASALNFKGGGGLTAAGFQFVLDERQQQLWRLVISFLQKDGAGATGKQRALQALLAIGELGLGERLTSSAPRQFLRFLVELGVLHEAAAHPQQRQLRQGEGEGGEGSSVPSNVCGQLEVWESSRSRAASSSAVLFEWSADDCEDTFEEAKKLAQAQGALLWSRGREADRAPVLVVRPEAAARLRELLGVAMPKPPKPPKPVPKPASAAFAQSLNQSKRLKLEKDL
eukprot:s3799_g10.t1